jgi:steroid 5-alpha reductase family enzyme
LFACATGGIWTIFSPLIMTILLLRVSGVVLLEKNLIISKPAYREYIETTSAFFPWFPKKRKSA